MHAHKKNDNDVANVSFSKSYVRVPVHTFDCLKCKS